MKNCRHSIWVLVVGVVTGCIGQVDPPGVISRLVEGDAKRFVYTVSGRPQGGRSVEQLEASSTGRSGSRNLSFDQLEDYLEDKMKLDGFCTQGYFVYDRQYDGRDYRLLGECNESV